MRVRPSHLVSKGALEFFTFFNCFNCLPVLYVSILIRQSPASLFFNRTLLLEVSSFCGLRMVSGQSTGLAFWT